MNESDKNNDDMRDEHVQPVLVPITAPVHKTRGGFREKLRAFFVSKFKKNTAISTRRKWCVGVLWAVGLPAYFTLSGILAWFVWVAQDMPDTSALWAPKSTPLIVIQDRHGREILRTGGAEAKPVILAELPPSLIQAIIAIEDHRFYHHPGFDVIGLMRAMQANIKAGRVVQGGSTLTQQLAKNVFLTRRQTMKRKSQEILLAVWLEHRLTKTEILETYLSRVYFGGGTIGIESGAQRFFNKPARDLNVGESALLAGILQAPDRLNPVKNTVASGRRTAQVLLEMQLRNYLTPEQTQIAMRDPIEVEPTSVQKIAHARYFTDWILTRIDQEIGVPRQDIIVHTSLDLLIQQAAQAAVTRGVNTKRNAQQASLVSFDGTGGVRAMVGGASYIHSSYNRVLRARRQPGSAFKPFVYLAAIQAGIAPWDTRVDAPVNIDGWQPGNFSNKYLGELSLETSLALSINTIAVGLAEEVGRASVVKTAGVMGLGGFKAYASLALGAQEVTLYDLVAAYIPFANWGYGVTPYGLEAIYGADGTTIYTRPLAPKPLLLNSKELGQMNLMLRTVIERGTGKAARISGRDVAGKTGTTNDYRDAWFVGYTADMVTGVWVGNDDNSKMARITGGYIPARIWRDYMDAALENTPYTKLPTAIRPEVKPVRVSSPTEMQTRKTLEELLLEVEKSFQ